MARRYGNRDCSKEGGTVCFAFCVVVCIITFSVRCIQWPLLENIMRAAYVMGFQMM